MQLLDDDGSKIVYGKNTVNEVADNLVFNEDEKIEQLPDVPLQFKEWTLKVRPTIDGMDNIIKYIPMYQRLYEDEWNWIMIKFARQTGKSTYDASRLGWFATTKPNKRAVYVTYEDESLSVFSNERFRDALWYESPIANKYVVGSTLGSVGLVKTKIHSGIRLVTGVNNFKHVEGKSAKLLIFDEGQYLNLDAWGRAKESQSFTHGDFILTGIGGFVDTGYHKKWLETDQRKWYYKNEYWRDKLEFRKSGHDRLIFGDYMLDVLEGYWRAIAPENGNKHGYHLTQYDVPWVPLKKSDCEKYGVNEDQSIEYKLGDMTQDDFRQHILAEDIQGELKPITEKMMESLLDRNIHFTPSDKIDKSLGKIYLGCDWGGGKKTIVWIWQCIDTNGPVFRLLYASKANTDDTHEQYLQIRDLIDSYDVDQAVVDAGGGTHQVQELMKHFGPRCRKNYYLTTPGKNPSEYDSKFLEKIRKENKWEEDKTFSISSTIDLIKRPIVYGATATPRIIIPAADRERVDWIIEQFTAEEAELVKLKGQGQPYTRYYTPDGKLHPDDALHACNYARIAWYVDTHENQDTWWFSA